MKTVKKTVKKAQNGATTKTVDINKSNGVFAPITVSKSKYDSVLNKRKASMDSSRAEFNKKLKEAKEKNKSSTIKKAQNGQEVGDYFWKTPNYKGGNVGDKKPMTSVVRSNDKNYRKKTTYLGIDDEGNSPRIVKERRTLKGFLTGAPKAGGTMKQVYKKGGSIRKSMKTGGKIKKCAYGCK